ncbi:MAG TPA: hypothetical protein VFV34_17310 [Blastocatellia bacterium]|nr:hypothetical protein [Blastocatellia bacterium]
MSKTVLCRAENISSVGRPLGSAQFKKEGRGVEIRLGDPGHSKIGMTADIYAHVSETTIQEEMDKIEAVIG